MAKKKATPPTSATTRTSLLAFGLLSLFTALFFFRALWSGCFVAVDFHLTFQPLREILADTLSSGLPLWNDRLGNGTPLLANPMHAALYPPTLLCALFPTARTLTVLTVAHLLFGACGAWLLAQRLGHSTAGSWLSAILFGFNGAAISSTSFANLCWSVAWLPWLLLTTDRLLDRRSPLATVLPLALVTAALLVLGDPFILCAGVVGAILWSSTGLGESLRKGSRGAFGTQIGRMVAGPSIGLLLASPVLIALLRYYPASVRALGFNPEGMTVWSFPPALAINFIVPSPFGDPGAVGVHRFWASTLFPDRGAPLLIGFYIGAVVLCLTVLGLTVAARHRWVLTAWFGVLVLLALGRHGPIYSLIDGWSGAATLRFPIKWMLPAMLPVALLAGRGVDVVASATKKPSTRRTVWLAVLAVFSVLAVLAMIATPALDGWLHAIADPPAANADTTAGDRLFDVFRGQYSTSVTQAAVPLLLIAGVLVWGFRSKTRSLAVAYLLVAIVAGDLLIHNKSLAPTVRPEFYRRVPPVIERILEERSVGRVFVDTAPENLGFARPADSVATASAWQRDLLRGYTPAAFGIKLAFNTDTEDLGPVRIKGLQLLVWNAPLREKLMLLGAAGVTHVASFHPFDHPAADPVARFSGPTVQPQRLYRNRLALPRARIVPTLLPYDGDSGFIRAVERGPEDLFERVALVNAADAAEAGLRTSRLAASALDGVAASAGSARLVEDGSSRLRIHCKGSGGFLVVSDAFTPGWTARVDGELKPIIPVDYAFRAVQIPAGTHEVVFKYWPW